MRHISAADQIAYNFHSLPYRQDFNITISRYRGTVLAEILADYMKMDCERSTKKTAVASSLLDDLTRSRSAWEGIPFKGPKR